MSLATCLWPDHNFFLYKMDSNILCPSAFRMRKISFLRFSQYNLTCVWPQTNLSARKTNYLGQRNFVFWKVLDSANRPPQWHITLEAPTPVTMSQHGAHSCQLAQNSCARIRREQGPQPFPLPLNF